MVKIEGFIFYGDEMPPGCRDDIQDLSCFEGSVVF